MSLAESSSTSVSLVDGIRRRLDQDWERYVQVYSPLLARWCWDLGVRGHDVADIIQQVHAIVVQKIDTFDHERPQATFRGWLYRILANEVVNLWRHRRRDGESLTNPDQIPDKPSRTADEDRRDVQGLIVQTLQLLEAEFSQPTQAAFSSRYFDGKEIDEIAAELGLSRGAVRARINRARTRLGELLRPEFPELVHRDDKVPPDG